MPNIHISKKASDELLRLACQDSLEISREVAKVAGLLKHLDEKSKFPGWNISSYNNDEILLKTYANERKQLWRAYPIHQHCIGLMEIKIIDEDLYVLAACDRDRILIVEIGYRDSA
jgi:hypothetical protein